MTFLCFIRLFKFEVNMKLGFFLEFSLNEEKLQLREKTRHSFCSFSFLTKNKRHVLAVALAHTVSVIRVKETAETCR